MVWFRVDDNLAFHQKVIAAGNAAIGLWSRAGSWSGQTLSDGFIPDDVAKQLGTKSQADKLVEVGLWHRLPTGYAFHEWDERQPTKAHVEAERAAAKERQRVSRERRRRDSGEQEGLDGF